MNRSSTAPGDVLQLSSGALGLSVSARTGRLLSLTSNAGLLSASLNAEVCHPAHTAAAPRNLPMLMMGPATGVNPGESVKR